MLTKRSARVHAFNIVWYPPRADGSRSENESCFEEGGRERDGLAHNCLDTGSNGA